MNHVDIAKKAEVVGEKMLRYFDKLHADKFELMFDTSRSIRRGIL